MPIHWDWDWDWDWDWPHEHFWHWPSTRYWPIDSFSYHASRCPISSRRWKTSLAQQQRYNYIDIGVCARDWHIHHMMMNDDIDDATMWCHRSCLASRVILETGDESDTNGKGTFKVIIDVHHFRHDELLVKVRNNDTIILTGKQKDDRGKQSKFCITREFTRKYKLPRNYDATLAKATRSTDGILTIMVPAPPQLDDVERLVEIEQTGAYFDTTMPSSDDSKAKAIENGRSNEEMDDRDGKEAEGGEKSKKARIDSGGDEK